MTGELSAEAIIDQLRSAAGCPSISAPHACASSVVISGSTIELDCARCRSKSLTLAADATHFVIEKLDADGRATGHIGAARNPALAKAIFDQAKKRNHRARLQLRRGFEILHRT